MSNARKILIVGGGLAGLCVGIQLIRKGAAVTLIDRGENFGSRIAAGMINPLVFRRMTRSWRVDDFLPYLREFYHSIEEESKSAFFRDVPIRRLFSSEQERGYWLKKQERDDFAPYMTRVTPEDDAYSTTLNAFGSGRVKQAAAVESTTFLSVAKTILQSKAEVVTEVFSFDHLDGTTYRGTAYDDVVFCEGYEGKSNPYFGYLPMNQTKGEVLTIRSEVLPEHESVNRKCFVLPIGEKEFKVGSTYVWHTPTTNITEEGKQAILDKLAYLIEEDVTVVEQLAGVRPTTEDRRPFIGTHHDHPNYHIFNGLGAKGYMTAPLLSEEFSEYLLNGAELHPDVDIKRFYPGE